jgi:hypothetical protein
MGFGFKACGSSLEVRRILAHALNGGSVQNKMQIIILCISTSVPCVDYMLLKSQHILGIQEHLQGVYHIKRKLYNPYILKIKDLKYPSHKFIIKG